MQEVLFWCTIHWQRCCRISGIAEGGGASGDNIASFFDVRARPLLLDGLANDDLHRRHFCLYGLEGPIGYEETLLVLKFSPSGLPSDYFFIADSPDDPVLLQR